METKNNKLGSIQGGHTIGRPTPSKTQQPVTPKVTDGKGLGRPVPGKK